MISELWNFIKSFNEKLLLYMTVVTSFVFFGSFPNLVVKLFFLCIHIVTGALFTVVFSFDFVYPSIKVVLAARKGIRIPIPMEISKLQQRMGKRINGIKVVEGINNICVTIRNDILIERKFLEILDKDEITGAIAHEIAHKKGKHAIWKLLATIAAILIASFSWSNLYSPIFFNETFTQFMLSIFAAISLSAFTLVMTIPVSWLLEFKADETAAKFVGKENIKSALIKLTPKEKLNIASETHPSTLERVKRLDKLKTMS